MKVIVLTGIVSVEKIALTRELAEYFANKKRVVVIDNIARMPIDELGKNISIQRVDGDSVTALLEKLQSTVADIVIVAVTEEAHPEKLFVALDELQEQQSDWEIYTLALIDTRTCDCFPNLREALEIYANVSVMMPYQLDEILDYVNHD